MKIKTITVVVPCSDEAECLPDFYRRVATLASSRIRSAVRFGGNGP